MNSIQQFSHLGGKASYHYADDSTREWGQASNCVTQAMIIYEALPYQRGAMREIAAGFLWAREFRVKADAIDADAKREVLEVVSV